MTDSPTGALSEREAIIEWIRNNYQDHNIASLCEGIRALASRSTEPGGEAEPGIALVNATAKLLDVANKENPAQALAAIQADLQIMVASAEAEGDAWFTSYRIKTGALHRMIGTMQDAGYPVNFPAVSMKRLEALASTPPPISASKDEQQADEGEALRAWSRARAKAGLCTCSNCHSKETK